MAVGKKKRAAADDCVKDEADVEPVEKPPKKTKKKSEHQEGAAVPEQPECLKVAIPDDAGVSASVAEACQEGEGKTGKVKETWPNKEDGRRKSDKPWGRKILRRRATRIERFKNWVDKEERGKEYIAWNVEKPPEDEPVGVVYIGHIPRGFEEGNMRNFFKQFGEIHHVRHARAKISRRSKGYGWIMFKHMSVAKVVAQTMNGYLLYGKKLVVDVVDPDKVHPQMFSKWVMKPKINRENINRKVAMKSYNKRYWEKQEGEKIPFASESAVARKRKSTNRLKKTLDQFEMDFDPSVLEGDGEEIEITGVQVKKSKLPDHLNRLPGGKFPKPERRRNKELANMDSKPESAEIAS